MTESESVEAGKELGSQSRGGSGRAHCVVC